MKRIILILSLLLSFAAFSQQTQYLGAPNVTLDSRSPFAFIVKDTTFTPTRAGVTVFRQADSSLYVSVATTGLKWKKVAAGAGAALFLDTLSANPVVQTWNKPGTDSIYDIHVNGDTTFRFVFPIADGIIEGGEVTYVSDYIYDVSAATYRIGKVTYTSPTTRITLDAADATNDRRDAIVLNTSGVATKKTGTAASNPADPQIDGSELALTMITVEAATTAPSAPPTTASIYDENAGSPTEYTTASSGTVTVDFNGTGEVLNGSKSITVSSFNNGAYLSFTKASAESVYQYASIKFWIRLSATMPGTTSAMVQLLKAGQRSTYPISIRLNKSSVNAWQPVTVNMALFSFLKSQFDEVRVVFFTNGTAYTSPLYFDAITFQTQFADPAPSSVPAQFNPIAGNNVSITGTYPNKTFNVSAADSLNTPMNMLWQDAVGNFHKAAPSAGGPFVTGLSLYDTSGGTYTILFNKNASAAADTLRLNLNAFTKTQADSLYVPLSRIITINGVAYNLSSNPTWTFPTLTYSYTPGMYVNGYGNAYLNSDSIATGADGNHLFATTTEKATWNGKLDKTFGTQGSVLFRGAAGISEDNSMVYYDSTNKRFGLGLNSSLSARLHIKGRDSTSSNYSLKIQSTSTSLPEIFNVRNDGVVGINQLPTCSGCVLDVRGAIRAQGLIYYGTDNNSYVANISNIMQMYSANNLVRLRSDAAAGIVIVANNASGNINLQTANASNAVNVGPSGVLTMTPTKQTGASASFTQINLANDTVISNASGSSGTVTNYITLRASPIFNTTASGQTYTFLDYNPNVVNYGGTMYAALFRKGNVGVGTNTPSAALQATGYGTTSATTSFAVHDATGTSNSLVVKGDGYVGIGTASPSTSLDINGSTLRVRVSKTPASATDTGNQGDWCWDSSYLYICVATNTWKRVAISSW